MKHLLVCLLLLGTSALAADQAALKNCLTDHYWDWIAPGISTQARFQSNGSLHLKSGQKLTWKILDARRVEVTSASGKAMVLEFDESCSLFGSNDPAGTVSGVRTEKVPPVLAEILPRRAWDWHQSWGPPSQRWTEVRFRENGTFSAYRGLEETFQGTWESNGPNKIKIPNPNQRIKLISGFGYHLTFNPAFTHFEATDLGRRQVPGKDIGEASQKPKPLPPPKPEDEKRTAPVHVGGDSNGGTNFGIGDTKRTMHVHVNTASDDHIHVSLQAMWVVLNAEGKPVPSCVETRRYTIGGDHPGGGGFSITTTFRRTDGATPGIISPDNGGVLRGWVAHAYDVNGQHIGSASNLPIYSTVGRKERLK